METGKENVIVAAIVLAIAAFGFAVGLWAGLEIEQKRWRKEAVSRGCAEWVVTDDSGKIEWRWK